MENELLKTRKFTVVEKEFPQGPTAIIRHPGAVVILPVFENGDICLISNHRKAIDKSLIELPAGTLESHEPPIATAVRELAEETGYRADQMDPLFDYFVSPGILDEKMYAFVATRLTAGPTNLMPDEEIETLTVSFDEAIRWIQSGKIEDAKTIATLLYFKEFGAEQN